MEINYYEKDRVSNSLLSKFDFFSSKGILDRFDIMKKESTKAMDFGRILHICLDKGLCIEYNNTEIPEEFTNAQVKIIKSPENITDAYCEEYENADTRKYRSEGVITAKLKTAIELLKPYYEEYNENRDKIISNGNIEVTKADYYLIKELVYAVDNCKEWQELQMEYFMMENTEIINEMVIEWELEGVECKSMLDKVMINHTDKTIDLIDYKSYTGNFTRNYRSHNIYRQLAFYREALEYLYPDYTITCYIVAIDKDYKVADLIRIGNMDIFVGKRGGFVKPYSNFDESGFLCCTDVLNKFWDYTEEGYIKGFNQLIREYKEWIKTVNTINP
jgi:hypothetical protein